MDVAVTAGDASNQIPYLEQIERVMSLIPIQGATADSVYDYIQSSFIFENMLQQPTLDPAGPLVFCDLIQIVTFDTEADLAAYPHDPYHMAKVNETAHLVDRVCIVDFLPEEWCDNGARP